MLKGNLTCETINKLLTHYVEDNLDAKSKNMVSMHLRNCPPCMEKYTVVQKLFREAEKKRKLIKTREAMQEDISAYLDGEMQEREIITFEEKLSTKPEFEENLLNTMKLKRTLNNSFYKMKYNLDTNLSKKAMEKYKNSGFKNFLKKIINYFFQ